MIVVSGIFREPSDHLLIPEKFYSFNRTFVLYCLNAQEFCIVNEQVHLTNATTQQQQKAFKFEKPTTTYTLEVSTPQNIREENELVEALRQITTLNDEWSRKCLEECNYNLKKALILFTDLYKVDKIPPEAFSM